MLFELKSKFVGILATAVTAAAAVVLAGCAPSGGATLADRESLADDGYRAMTAADIDSLQRASYSCLVHSSVTGTFIAQNDGFIYNDADGPFGEGDYLATRWINESFEQYAILKLLSQKDGDFSYSGAVVTRRGNAEEIFLDGSRVDIFFHPDNKQIVFFDVADERSTTSYCVKNSGRAPLSVLRLIERDDVE